MDWNSLGVLKMTAAECTSTSFKQLAPIPNKKLIYVQATSTNAADYITVTGLSVVEGAFLISSTGATVATFGAFATNVITLANGATGTKIWSGWAWGY